MHTSLDITAKYKELGIGPTEFVRDGYFLELMLLSSIRSDGLSNLGYGYSESFIVKMGTCSFNVTFGRILISSVLGKILGLNSILVDLNNCTFKYGQLSILYNLFAQADMQTMNLQVYGLNVFVDITPIISFTINRTQKYIRNLKDALEKAFENESVKVKGKYYSLNSESSATIEHKLEVLKQHYSQSVIEDYKGNYGLYASLGGIDGVNFFTTNLDAVHAETYLILTYDEKKLRNIGDIRVTAINLGYKPWLTIEDIIGYDENAQLLIQMHNDIRAGFNYILGVVDAWSSLRDNRLSIFDR